jgi:Fur family ferric uptake transcriptional regulator
LRAEKPLSHGELVELLDEQGFDRATIYRNLMDLTGGGLVARADMGDHVWRFEVRAHEAALHPHFMCTSCGAVQCLPESAVNVAAPSIKGAVRRVDEVLLKGACAACG